MVIELKKSRVFEILYTGGDIAQNAEGSLLFTTCTNVVKVLNVDDGSERLFIGNKDEDPRITSFALSSDDKQIIIAYANDIIKRYILSSTAGILTATFQRQFRGMHKAPILLLQILTIHDRVILATGSADFSVKIWDLTSQFCTHNFMGKSLVSALCFLDQGRGLLVGYNEGQVRLFNLMDSAKHKRLSVEWSNHTSRIVSICLFSLTNKQSIDGAIIFSRDQKVTVLNLKTFAKVKEFQLKETIEKAIYLYRNEEHQFLTVGEAGILKLWSLDEMKVIKEKIVSKTQLDTIIYCDKAETVLCASAECDLMFVELDTMKIFKQLAGYNDELFAACLISEKSNCLAVANNSSNLIIYDLATSNCHLVMGHEQSIMTVDSPIWDDHLLATGSKDNSIILWEISEKQEQKSVSDSFLKKIAFGTGHTHSVTSLKFSNLKTNGFIVTVSNDSTLKIWPMKQLIRDNPNEVQKLTPTSTIVAHSNSEINTVDVSLNDKLCVTASMDKTAKLWHIDKKTYEFCIAGTLSGHKRGVWAAKFSKNFQTVATCSGDSTIKLFSLLDNSCLQTLSGHSFAVFSIVFARNSTTLISVDGGGFMKIWDLDKGICEKTDEAHTSKIWLVADIGKCPTLKKDEKNASESLLALENMKEPNDRYVSVGSEGQLIIWEDISHEIEEKQANENTKKMADQQSLANYLEQENFAEALILTLDLGKPYQCHKVVTKLLDYNDLEEIKAVLSRLDSLQLGILLSYAAEWNTNTRTYNTGQALLNQILKSVSPTTLLRLQNIDTIIQSFLPYTNRHYERLWDLRTNVHHLDYTFSRMRLN